MAKYPEHLKLPEVDYLPLHPPKHHLQTWEQLSGILQRDGQIPGFPLGNLAKLSTSISQV